MGGAGMVPEPLAYLAHTSPTTTGETRMKVKSRIRAGKSINHTVVSYVPPVSRCVGI